MLRLSALLYDKVMDGPERGQLGAWRGELLAPLVGSVLEIGAGTGRNLSRYPQTVSALVLVEPDRHLRARLQRAVAAADRDTRVLDASAEHLPIPDASIDAVVSTLVLCSVPDQQVALEEVRRVLRPGGALVFIEHVAADDCPPRLRWQHRIEPLWRAVAGNCHLTRDTESAITAGGFTLQSITRESLKSVPPFVRPTIRGCAVRDES